MNRTEHTHVKIALLGDIHANLPALDSVIQHAEQQGAQEIWNIGDFVGYGAFPEEVVQRMRPYESTSIIGNYDLKVLRFPRQREKWRKSKHPYKWLAFQWAYDHISGESRDFLANLPKERIIQKECQHFLLTHGSPASNEEALDQNTTLDHLRGLYHLAEHRYQVKLAAIICGHSHQAFAREVNHSWVVNTGSVGRPDDGDPRACYALLSLVDNTIAIEHFLVEYNLDQAVQAIRKNGLPEAFAQMLIRGRDLETILHG
jgi:putative phosphoesterase